VDLAPLAPEEVAKLVLGLAEQPVDPDVEQRIVEHAGGNPLFAEQLLALATEAPDLALADTPPTVEALLASRLDRLDPRELAVLRRASVVGRRFTREELGDLTPPEEAGGTDHHLADLAERALVHPREQVFAFHHVLVRDVAYRGIPKAERADLHELAARGLDRRNGPDEIVGFHYEQAYCCLTDIGGGEHACELAASGGERLGRAGMRAWRRADAPAAVNLLTRAVELVPEPSDLVCELGLALFVNGNRALAEPLLRRAVEAPDERIAARGRLELAELRSTVEPDGTAELVSTATAAIPILEAADDERALGRAWLCLAHAHGGFLCEYDAAVDAAEHAVAYYRKAAWSPSAALQHLGAAMYFGAKPVDEAIARSLSLLQEFDGDRASEANVLMWLGGLEAMHASFESARGRVERARQLYLQLGLTSAAGDDCSRVLGFIELLAGAPGLAEEHFRRSCEMLRDRHQTQVLATRAGELAAAFYAEGRYDEAASWVALAEETAGRDDLDAALAWQPVAAMLTARRGATEKAERRIRDVMLDTPDGALTHRAATFLALAEILQLAGRSRESVIAMETALALFEQKGNVAGASLARTLALEEASANR